MRSALYVPAPSTTLLNFLKSQSEAICFFSPNPQHLNHASSRAPQSSPRSIFKAPKIPTRCISATVARRATVEAGLLNLKSLWSQSPSTLHPQSAQCRTTARNGGANNGRTLLAHRKASSGSKKWLERLWGSKSSKGGRPLRPDDLPTPLRGREDGGDTSVFSLGRAVSAKAAAQPKLRCTELDEYGNVVLGGGEFKKSELIAKVYI